MKKAWKRICLSVLVWLLSGAGVSRSAGGEPFLQLVETYPVETQLDHADIPDAFDVWREMIASATESIELAEFYASNAPGSRLESIVSALETAAGRGVSIRFLAEKQFHDTYPETLDRLQRVAGIETRLYDVASLMGGVLHAKYFIVDGAEAYLGSQNFDWRSLTHIQELGVRIHERTFVGALRDLFTTDWQLAGGVDRSFRSDPHSLENPFPAEVVVNGDTLRITPAFSPIGWLPNDALWDLPPLLAMVRSARSSVRLQLLTYRMTGQAGFFEPLEDALRDAAARGITVQLLLSDWCKRPGTIEGLQSLQVLPGIEVRLVTIPPWSGGFIPYARVIHAKYFVVDDRICWIGTSNWEKDYFYSSRNVGLIIEGDGIASRLNRFFLDGWNGPYAETVDPCTNYSPPRIGE